MNKLVKGAIAGAAGIALLAGGAGTFALWNSSSELDAGNIVAGNLLVEDSGTAGVWSVGGTAVSLATYRVSPGDVLVYTKTEKVTVTGDALVATLNLAGGSIVGKTSGTADVALATELTKSAVLTASGTGIVGSNNVYTFTAGANPGLVAKTVTVAVTITFPKSVTPNAENASKLGSVDFSGLNVVLTQN